MQNDSDLTNNPYAPTIIPSDGESELHWSDAERIRDEHIKQEADIRAVGYLFYLGAVFVGILAISLPVELADSMRANTTQDIVLGVVGCLILTGLTALLLWCGRGLRCLDHRVRWPVILLIAPGFLAVPIGPFIAIQIMLLVGNEKGKFILSPEYQLIRQVTPHVRGYSSTFRLLLIGAVVAMTIIALLIWTLDG